MGSDLQGWFAVPNEFEMSVGNAARAVKMTSTLGVRRR